MRFELFTQYVEQVLNKISIHKVKSSTAWKEATWRSKLTNLNTRYVLFTTQIGKLSSYSNLGTYYWFERLDFFSAVSKNHKNKMFISFFLGLYYISGIHVRSAFHQNHRHTTLKLGFCNKSFRKDEILTSWTLLCTIY